MSLDKNDSAYVEGLASESLGQFAAIAAAAKQKRKDAISDSTATLAQPQTWTAGDVAGQLSNIAAAVVESADKLSSEPAIARVVVIDGEGAEKTFYICRATPVAGVSGLASYRSPIGKLASTPVGSDKDIPGIGHFEVVERAQFHPHEDQAGWDSKNNLVEAEQAGPVTIVSFRDFLQDAAGRAEVENVLEQLLADEKQQANVIAGLRRSVITKMGLRDQPILDQFQDEIFRLPINSKLLLLGPAGTGKTTTLIRRLGQKLDTAYLDNREKAVVDRAVQEQGAPHSRSWLMFTPTELLKHYLKESFAREGIPAPDQCINTWDHYRRYIARDVLTVLKTSTGSGSFVVREQSEILRGDAISDATVWYEDFDEWQRKTFLQELCKAASGLNQSDADDARAIGARLSKILDGAADTLSVSVFRALVVEIPEVRKLRSDRKQSTDSIIKKGLNLQLVNDKSLLDDLAEFLETLKVVDDLEEDEEDDEVEDDDAGELAGHGQRIAALKAYNRAMRSYARSLARKRRVRPGSRTGQLLEWLGDRVPSEDELQNIGQSLIIQSHAGRFVNPVRGFLNGVPRKYRAFRRMRHKEERWYEAEKIPARDLHPLELDIVLLAMLRGAQSLIRDKQVARNIGSPGWAVLEQHFGLCRHQILVDEAPDFSPIQLACMAAISDPSIDSFFACGDFNQRLTRWGSRSDASLKWACPAIVTHKINVTYRQTKQLNELAHEILVAVGGSDDGASLPPGFENDGVDPALLEGSADLSKIVDWLACRIRDIEQFVDQLPSIAIFVNGEDKINPLAEALNAAVVEENIPVVPCPNGQVMGQENEVRVFDIQHIKGLEFEAVFFIAVDDLAKQEPDLFDKYLYVGATRAATYLGLTCDAELPDVIAGLRQRFVSSWS